MSGAGGKFTSEKIKNFFNSLNVEQTASSSYHHQSNRQVQMHYKKFSDSSGDIHMAMIQHYNTTPMGQGIPSCAMLLFNCPVRGIMPVMDRPPINVDNDDEHHQTLMHRQGKNDQGSDTSKLFMSIPIGSTVAVQ